MAETKISPPLPLVPPITPTEAAQGEAVTRPVIGGKGQGPRQQELHRELDAAKIKKAKARADFDAGEISVEQFHEITGTH